MLKFLLCAVMALCAFRSVHAEKFYLGSPTQKWTWTAERNHQIFAQIELHASSFSKSVFNVSVFYRSSVRSLRHSVSFGLSPIIGIQEVATHTVGS